MGFRSSSLYKDIFFISMERHHHVRDKLVYL